MNNFILSNNPTIRLLIAKLRNRSTGEEEFRKIVKQIATMMIPEVITNTPIKKIKIDAPCGNYEEDLIDQSALAFIAVPRAGKVVSDAFSGVFPMASLGSMYVTGKGGHPEFKFANLPSNISGKVVFVMEQIIWSGGTASDVVRRLKETGCKDIRVVALFATQKGIDKINKDHPDVSVHICTIDEVADPDNYIFPYTGDLGDRSYGDNKDVLNLPI